LVSLFALTIYSGLECSILLETVPQRQKDATARIGSKDEVERCKRGGRKVDYE
jgi:hypothetical protein